MTSAERRLRLRSLTVAVVSLLVIGVTIVALAARDGDRPRTYTGDGMATTEPGTVARAAAGTAGPVGGSCTGVDVAAGTNIHRVMRRHRPGTTFCLESGLHRIARPLRPQQGDTIQGMPGAVLNGARVVTGWQSSAHGWTAPGFLPASPSNDGECLSGTPSCVLTEDVFVDGRRLVRVGSAGEVIPGTFFGDYRTNMITIGTDPTGSSVEQAVASGLVRSGHDRVTVRGLVLEMAANDAQVAAVDSRRVFPRAGTGWQVVHNVVRLNHGVGVGVGTRGRVRANIIRDQGQLGVSVWGAEVQLRGNEIAYNGLAGYDPEWEAGGVKSWKTVSALIVGNHVHHNSGPGLWSDGGCYGTEYRRNEITDNLLAGIQHEISYDALIVGNRVLRNGAVHKGWAWEAGIQIQSSGGGGLIEIRHNEVADNTHGIAVIDSSDRRREVPHPRGPHIVRNVFIHHNVITLSPGQWSGLFHDYGNHSVFRRGIRFRANTYHLDSYDQQSFGWEDELLTWEQWRSGRADQDRGGTVVVDDP